MDKRTIEKISKRQNEILVKLNKKPVDVNIITVYNVYILSTVVMSILSLIFMVNIKENVISGLLIFGIILNGIVILCKQLKRSLG